MFIMYKQIISIEKILEIKIRLSVIDYQRLLWNFLSVTSERQYSMLHLGNLSHINSFNRSIYVLGLTSLLFNSKRSTRRKGKLTIISPQFISYTKTASLKSTAIQLASSLPKLANWCEPWWEKDLKWSISGWFQLD